MALILVLLLQVGENQDECLSACNDQINNVGVTSSDFPNRETFVKREEFCITLTKLNRTCHSEKAAFLIAKFPTVCNNIQRFSEIIMAKMNLPLCKDLRWDMIRRWGVTLNSSNLKDLEEDIFQYAKKNLAVVNVYIKDPVVTRIMRDQKIPVIAFVANTGGLLGLCMGFSLVSLFEILYHLIGSFNNYWNAAANITAPMTPKTPITERTTVMTTSVSREHQISNPTNGSCIQVTVSKGSSESLKLIPRNQTGSSLDSPNQTDAPASSTSQHDCLVQTGCRYSRHNTIQGVKERLL